MFGCDEGYFKSDSAERRIVLRILFVISFTYCGFQKKIHTEFDTNEITKMTSFLFTLQTHLILFFFI